MKKITTLLTLILLSSALSGCIIVPEHHPYYHPAGVYYTPGCCWR